VEPTPTSLFTQIRPPCSSTNFRHSVSPSPVPSTFFSAVPTCRNSSKTASWSSGAMPTPVSLTETSTSPSFGTAPTSIRPPSGVNLIAFDNRFQDDLPPLVRLNLAQSAIDVHLQGDPSPPRTLADQGQGAVECRREVEVGELELHPPG